MLMEVSTPKTEGKPHHAQSSWCINFTFVFGWIPPSTQKNITTIPHHFISTLLIANFNFDVSVTNDVSIDVAKYALPDKVMRWSHCPEVHTLTKENGRFKLKLNDCWRKLHSVKYKNFLCIYDARIVVAQNYFSSIYCAYRNFHDKHSYLKDCD